MISGIFYYQLNSSGEKVKNLKSHGGITQGTVEREFKGVEYVYEVNGEIFSHSQRFKPRGLINGEVFKVLYDRESPDISMIDFAAPIFDTLDYDKVCLNDFDIIDGDSTGLISFSYEYNGKKYTRHHSINYSNIKNRSPYTIWVKRSLPQQSYLVIGRCLSTPAQ